MTVGEIVASIIGVIAIVVPIVGTIVWDGHRTRVRVAVLEERSRIHGAMLERHMDDEAAHVGFTSSRGIGRRRVP